MKEKQKEREKAIIKMKMLQRNYAGNVVTRQTFFKNIVASNGE